MASYAGSKLTFQQQQQQQQHIQYQAQNVRNESLSILAQAKPAIISSNGGVSVAANGYFNGCSNEDSDKSIAFAVSDHSHHLHHNHHQRSISFLSEKLDNALKTSVESSRAADDSSMRLNATHIEDDNVIHKQNASNQMRQAAVQAAVASQQQKVRLSATERLALTAKRPQQQQQQQQQIPVSSNQQDIQTASSTTNCATSRPTESTVKTTNSESVMLQHQKHLNARPLITRSTPLPTLETLLAVQRQLQQHTRQNLTTVPRDLNKDKQVQQLSPTLGTLETQLRQQITNHNSNSSEFQKSLTDGCAPNSHMSSSNFAETYEKDLPPLPDSVTPSTLTDDSQLNSLESQSSPATSLVSIPPPPPPLSTYLQQYDETNSHTRSPSSTSSTPSTICSSSDMSSIRQFPGVMPQKQAAHQPVDRGATANGSNGSSSSSNNNNSNNNNNNNKPLPAPNIRKDFLAQTKPSMPPPPPPPLAPKPAHLDVKKITSDVVVQQNYQKPGNNGPSKPLSTHLAVCDLKQRQHQQHNDKKTSVQLPEAREAAAIKANLEPAHLNKLSTKQANCDINKRQMDYRQHMFHPEASISKCNAADKYSSNELEKNDKKEAPLLPSSFSAPHLLPPPPSMLEPDDKLNSTCVSTSNLGFDEPDCGSFRFPTPPPPDMLLDEIGFEVDSYDKKKSAKDVHENFAKQSDQDNGGCSSGHNCEDYDEDDDDDDEDEDEDSSENDDDDNEVGEDEDDDDFQCKIPTPPPHKSMSVATFQSLVDCLPPGSGDSNKASTRNPSLFNASTFSTQTLTNNISENAKTTTTESSSTLCSSKIARLQPPPLFRQPKLPQEQQIRPSQSHQQQLQAAQLTVNINTDGTTPSATGLLATSRTDAAGSNRFHGDGVQNSHSLNHNHHHMMMAMAASSSSPSSSSDGDGQSSNSSSSTSGIHSSIDSPSSSNSKLDDFNYGNLVTSSNLPSQSRERTTTGTTTKMLQQLSYQHHHSIHHQPENSTQLAKRLTRASPTTLQNYNLNAKTHNSNPPVSSPTLAPKDVQASKAHATSRVSSTVTSSASVVYPPSTNSPVTAITPANTSAATLLRKTSISSTSSLQSLNSVTSAPGLPAPTNAARRPALKQKKTVSFSDKVELVACAEEQCDDHLPNPLLARVLAGKLQ